MKVLGQLTMAILLFPFFLVGILYAAVRTGIEAGVITFSEWLENLQ